MRRISIYLPVLAAILLLPSLCRADSVVVDNVTLTYGNLNISVNEGDSITLSFTVTNNSGSAINVAAVTVIEFPFVGDLTDEISSGSFAGTQCLGPLADGGSCTFTLDLKTPANSGETDADCGTTALPVGLTFSPSDSAVQFSFPVVTFDITVEDPGAKCVTPEPASLFLLATGLLGLAPAVRRRFV